MLQDLRFGLRLLARDRTFTITALLTLAVCIGANAAMLSIVRSVLLKPLPFPDSDRLVLLYNSYPNAGAPRVAASVPDYFDRQTDVPALEISALFQQGGMTLGDERGAERLELLRAMPSLFRMLGAAPAQGRIFTEAEGEPGKDKVVMLSYGFWQRRYGGAAVVNQTIRLNATPYQIVGVLPRDFNFLRDDLDIFVPASFPPDSRADNRRHNNNWQMVGKVKAGSTIETVRQQVDRLNARNDERFPEFRKILKDAGFHTVTVSLRDDLVRDVKSALYLLWGGVLFVLVIGCVNIANLIIVRAGGRAREMAMRHAIGGDLRRLARQLLTETTVLAVTGGALGILLGWWTLRSVAALNLDQLPRGYEIALDPVSIALIASLILIVGVVLGVAPVLRLRRLDLTTDLREESRGGSAGRRAQLLRTTMATVQIAIALVVLVGAGLLLASFQAVTHRDVGFNPANVETLTVSLPGSVYKDGPAVVAFKDRALGAIRALPEVEAAGGTTLVPFSGNMSNSVILGEGHVMKPGESLLAPTQATITSGYFEAMGVTLKSGRFFDQRDTLTSPAVAVIDERLAEMFWPGQDAVGRRLYRPEDPKDITRVTPETRFINVVGVVKEIQNLDPRGDVTPVGTVFHLFDQNNQGTFTLAVKTRTTGSIANTLRGTLAQIDPQVPAFRPRTMQEWIDRALVGRRVPMLIAVAFAAVALFLSSLGVYGVLAYGVSQRKRELGVRLALGGTSGRIFNLVLNDGMRIVAVGLAVGLVGSYFVGQLMKSQLVNITPTSPLVLVLVTLALSVVALTASLIPAWRASRISPIVVLSR